MRASVTMHSVEYRRAADRAGSVIGHAISAAAAAAVRSLVMNDLRSLIRRRRPLCKDFRAMDCRLSLPEVCTTAE